MKSKMAYVNIPVAELTRRLFAAGSIPAKGILLLVLFYLSLILVMPLTFLQFLFYSQKIKRTAITKQPVFILGHYRSGTTYLHKLIAVDGRFGFISYYDIICPNSSLLFGHCLKVTWQFIVNKLKIKTPFFNNTIPSLDDPAEEERFLVNKGSAYTDYWRFVFPLCWSRWQTCSQQCIDQRYFQHWRKEYLGLLKLATYKHKGKQLLLKSPPNMERIKYLLKIFPQAKFIYISRNPYHVFYSMCNLWQKAIRKFCLQSISDKQIEEIIFSDYSAMLERYETDKMSIPEGNLIEVRYEELESSPLAVLKKIYTTLNIPAFETVKGRLIRQLQKEKQYSKFKYEYDAETFKKVYKRWGKYIDQWKENVSPYVLNENV